MVRAPQKAPPQQGHSFQDPNPPVELRVNNIISLMTLDEKIACLGTNPSVPRLGIRGTGLRRLARAGAGRPRGWGRPTPIRATQFAQEIGIGETWDTDNSKVERACQELKGFKRTAIQPNETKTVTLSVKAEDLAYWDEKQNKWVVEEDQVKFTVGASSAGAKLEKTINVVQ